MNQADKLRQRHKLNRAKIAMLSGLSEDELSEMTFNAAYDYLQSIMQTDAYGMEYIPKTKEFWSWWAIEWGRIDQIFIAKVRTDHRVGLCTIEHPVTGQLWALYSREDISKFYRLYHEVSVDNIYINSSVMNASCHRMMKDLTGSIKQPLKSL